MAEWITAIATVALACIAHREFNFKHERDKAVTDLTQVEKKHNRLVGALFTDYRKVMASEAGIVFSDWPQNREQIITLLERETGHSGATIQATMDVLYESGRLQ